MRQWIIGAMASFAVTVFFTPSVSAQPDLQAGLWEITTQVEMPGMPMKMPPMTHTQCITQKDLVPQSEQPGQSCKITRTETRGNTVSYDMVCTTQSGKMTGHGSATYSGQRMSGAMEMNLGGPNPMQMSYSYSGRRIGNCP